MAGTREWEDIDNYKEVKRDIEEDLVEAVPPLLSDDPRSVPATQSERPSMDSREKTRPDAFTIVRTLHRDSPWRWRGGRAYS